MSDAINVNDYLKMVQRLELLSMSDSERKRFLGQVARKSRVAFRRNLRGQHTPDGKAWNKRKKGGRRKMLRKFSQDMQTGYDTKSAKIYFKNPVIGRGAYQHQHGFTEIMTKDKMEKIHGKPDYKANATRRQAKALKREGFRFRKEDGNGYRRASVKEIEETLKQGQAGVILRSMRDAEHTPNRWTIDVGSRAFAGFTDSQKKDIIQDVFDRTINKRRG